MAHLDHSHGLDLPARDRRHTDPVAALLFGILACVVMALALSEQFEALVPAAVACAAAFVVARLEVSTRDADQPRQSG